MSTIETLRAMSEVWSLFSDMPDDATIGVDLAALYLGVSVKTLARYRQNGDGPPYIQYQSSESKARNQRVNYLLGDLRNWRNGHRVSNTMQAAQLRGLTFTTLSDLTEFQPFWVNSCDAKVIGHVLCVTEDDFRTYLKSRTCTVLWLSVEDALQREWVFLNEREMWDLILNEVLNITRLKFISFQEKAIIKNLTK